MPAKTAAHTPRGSDRSSTKGKRPQRRPVVAALPSDENGGAGGKPVIRDSFTMPANDYARIGTLKKRCLTLGLAVKKSEMLRAGLHALERISDENLIVIVGAVEQIKTGRPSGKKHAKRKRIGKAQAR